MYHSMQFIPYDMDVFRTQDSPPKALLNGKNTWDDWHLIPASRPLIAPPKVKTNYIDIPGADGTLDATDVHTGYPLYENREGSNEFYVMNGYGDWASKYSEIMNYLQGRKMKVVLEDDPGFYYEGRCSVNEWRSEKDWSKIVIDYNVYPYKLESVAPGDTGWWLWDPFNFETGVIRGYYDEYGSIIQPMNDRKYMSYTHIELTAFNNFDAILRVDNVGFTMKTTPTFTIRAQNMPPYGLSTGVSISLYKDAYNPEDETENLIAKNHHRIYDTKYHKVKFYDTQIGDGTYYLRFQAAKTSITYYIIVNFRGGML